MKHILALIASLGLLSPAYADGTIDTLSAGAALGGTEQIPMFQTANPAVTTTPNAIKTFAGTTITTSGGASGGTCNPGTTCAISTQLPPVTLTTASPALSAAGSNLGAVIYLTNASADAPTIPGAGTANYPAGWYTTICNPAAFAKTITPGAGTIGNAATYSLAAGTNAAPSCIRIQSGSNNGTSDYGLSEVPGSTIATPVSGANGGTGVANTGSTITLGASLTTTGAGAVTLAFPGSPATFTLPAGTDTLAGLGTTQSFTAPQTFALGTITTNVKAINITGTWNNAGTTFDAPLFMNITNTASAASSLLQDLQIGGTTEFSVDKGGNVNMGPTIQFIGRGSIAGGEVNGFLFSSNIGNGAFLTIPAANTFQFGAADSSSPTAQVFETSNVVTGASNTPGVNWTIRGSQGTGTGAGGNIILSNAPAGTTGTSQNAEVQNIVLDQQLHVRVGAGTAPSLGASCAQGGGSATIIGTDQAGLVTAGTLATSCTVTFNIAYTSAPFCVVTWQGTVPATPTYSVTNTAITITQAGTTGDKINYICMAQNGG
jgi:hypothetical protein